MKCDFEEDAIILANVAKIVRNDIFYSKGVNVNGSFPSQCQQDSVPKSLKSMVAMLKGAGLKDQDSADSQTCLTVSQTIVFNCKKISHSVKFRHSLEF